MSAEQRIRGLREARLGVAHRRRRIAVHRAEVALAVDQHAGASRSPGPCAPARRRSRPGRAGGTCPSRRRRCARSCAAAGRGRSRPRAWRRGCADAPASGRRARPAARAPRSRSWRNRGRSAASPPRSARPRRDGAGWKPSWAVRLEGRSGNAGTLIRRRSSSRTLPFAQVLRCNRHPPDGRAGR